MEIRQLTTFSKIIELKSFSKAAQALGYSQSAVTVQIRLLEEELGVRLFDRIGKHTHLTPKGEEFRTYAYRILHEAEAAKQKISAAETPSGTLCIGAIDTICAAKLPALLQKFHEHCPLAAVRIVPGSPEALFEMLEKNQVDLIYILDDPRYSNDWHKVLEAQEEIIFVSTPRFFAEHAAISGISAEKKAAVAQPDEHPHTAGNTHEAIPAFHIETLLGYPFLLTEHGANYRRVFDQYLAAHQLILRPFLETSSPETLVRTLEDVNGISLLPRYYIEKEIRQHRLVPLPVEEIHIAMYRQIFYHRDKWLTPEMQLFLQLVTEAEQTNKERNC